MVANTSSTTPPMDTSNQFTFPNDGNTIIVFFRGNTASTITMVTPGVVDGDLAITDRSIVTAAGYNALGPFPPAIYNDAAGLAEFSLSSAAGVRIYIVQVSG